MLVLSSDVKMWGFFWKGVQTTRRARESRALLVEGSLHIRKQGLPGVSVGVFIHTASRVGAMDTPAANHLKEFLVRKCHCCWNAR